MKNNLDKCSHFLQALDNFVHVVLLAGVRGEGKVHIDSFEFNNRHFLPKHTDFMWRVNAKTLAFNANPSNNHSTLIKHE